MMINEIHELESGQVIRTHVSGVHCLQAPCTIHNPSSHPLYEAPRLWHGDKKIMMRVCPCGNAHVDPDEKRRDTYGCACHCDCCDTSEPNTELVA